jgi:radical SAM protein with 4Fe4S-binding SPASM domain
MEALLGVDPDRLTAVVNMTHYDGDQLPAAADRRRRMSLAALGGRALVGVTIVEPRVAYDWLPAFVRDAGCRPAMRIGIAHPILDGTNRFLHPKQYPRVAAGLIHLASLAAADGIRLELDCGFVRCMFSDDDLATLDRLNADVGWHCSPICDIEVDGRITHCFPLSTLPGVEGSHVEDASTARRLLGRHVAPYRSVGVYPECSSCRFHASGECPGGCRAATVLRFGRTEFRVAAPGAPPTPVLIRRHAPAAGGIR